MSDKKTGGCLCGNLRYEVTAALDTIVQCHCSNCQKVSGAGASTNFTVDADSLKFTKGEPKLYLDTANSGNKMNRAFCADCGSSIFSQRHNLMNKIILKAGSVDDSSQAKIVMNIWTNSGRPWVVTDPDVPTHAENRPM